MRRFLPALMFALLLPQKGQAALYGLAGGYRYTGGSRGYWGRDVGARATARIAGGWYPSFDVSASKDSHFSEVLGGGATLERGLVDFGRLRAGYFYYSGRLSAAPVYGSSQGAELGAFRYLPGKFTGDLSYRFTAGNLFSGAQRELNQATGAENVTLSYGVYHQAAATLGIPVRRASLLSAGAAAGGGSQGLHYFSQSVALTLPLVGSISLIGSASWVESNKSGASRYFGVGTGYVFSGSW